MELPPFDWEKEYGALWRANPLAFWLAPGPGDEKPQRSEYEKAMDKLAQANAKLDQALARHEPQNPYANAYSQMAARSYSPLQQASGSSSNYSSLLNAAAGILW